MPRLVCDPQEGVDYYLVAIDGETERSDAIETRLSFDLEHLSIGHHICTVQSCNMWGESEASPFEFTSILPGAPSGIGLEA